MADQGATDWAILLNCREGCGSLPVSVSKLDTIWQEGQRGC
jgi:hypothetical protein